MSCDDVTVPSLDVSSSALSGVVELVQSSSRRRDACQEYNPVRGLLSAFVPTTRLRLGDGYLVYRPNRNEVQLEIFSTSGMQISHTISWHMVTNSVDGQTLSQTHMPWRQAGQYRNISPDSSSPKCMELARSWVRECLEHGNHESCRGKSLTLPTRVIDVTSIRSNPRLYISNLSIGISYPGQRHGIEV